MYFLSDIITYLSFGSVKPHSQSVSFLKHFGVASMKWAFKAISGGQSSKHYVLVNYELTRR